MHVAPESEFDLPAWFRQFGHINVMQASHNERLREGVVFLPPPGHAVTVHDHHLGLEALGRTDRPHQTITDLFASAAKCCGERTLGVILSGSLSDGSKGLRALHEAEGLTVIQSDAEYGDMPANALGQVPDTTFRLKATDIGLTLDLLARRNAGLESGLATAVRVLNDRIALLVRLLEQSRGNAATHQYLSTELDSLRAVLRSLEALLSESE
jgi:two-component system, chemotaxis family, protein-glutamate methylesterase/glutaminase